jgi:hypothetical protein
MTPRAGLFVALIGLVVAVACAVPLYFIGDLDPVSDDGVMDIIVLNLFGLLGVTILVVGLIVAVATAVRGKQRHPSGLANVSYGDDAPKILDKKD